MLTLKSVILTAGMIGAAVYDIRNRLVDDRVCWLIALAGLVTISPASFWAQLLGFFCAGLPFYLGSGFGKNGAGDIWLAASAGFVLGIWRTIAGLTLFVVVYSVFVALYSLFLWCIHRPIPKSYPLVPFLTAGFLPAYFLI